MDFILLPQSFTEKIITKSLSLWHFRSAFLWFGTHVQLQLSNNQDVENKVLVCSLMQRIEGSNSTVASNCSPE